MIGGLRQLRAVLLKYKGLNRGFRRIIKSKAVMRGAADVGSDVALRGVKILRRSKKGGLIGRAFRSRKLRKALFATDVAATVGWAGLGVMEYQNLKKTSNQRQAAVSKFKKNLEKTKFELVRRAKRKGP